MRNGYIVIRVNRRAVYEHRHVMERHLGRRLARGEHVHHINGDKTDNRLENLEILLASDHHREHMTPERAASMSRMAHAVRWGYADL